MHQVLTKIENQNIYGVAVGTLSCLGLGLYASKWRSVKTRNLKFLTSSLTQVMKLWTKFFYIHQWQHTVLKLCLKSWLQLYIKILKMFLYITPHNVKQSKTVFECMFSSRVNLSVFPISVMIPGKLTTIELSKTLNLRSTASLISIYVFVILCWINGQINERFLPVNWWTRFDNRWGPVRLIWLLFSGNKY